MRPCAFASWSVKAGAKRTAAVAKVAEEFGMSKTAVQNAFARGTSRRWSCMSKSTSGATLGKADARDSEARRSHFQESADLAGSASWLR